MNERLILLTDSGIRFYDGNKTSDIASSTLSGYLSRAREVERSREWKSTGSGAAFMGTALPAGSSSSENIRSKVTCTAVLGNSLLYSLWIDEFGGIYSKLSPDDTNEGVFWSDSGCRVKHFSVCGSRMVAAVSYGAETHVAVFDGENMRQLTEGPSSESWPSFSELDPRYIYYGSSGFEIDAASENSDEQRTVLPMFGMLTPSAPKKLGPSAIFRINISTLEIDEILSDPKYNFEKPYHGRDGKIYFIKRPFSEKSGMKFSDILLAPARFIGAVGGFLNVFTMKYSGKTLTSSKGTKSKQKSEYDRIIEGNLINSEKELKSNRAYGDSDPGIIPRSFEFCAMSAQGDIKVLKKGINAFSPIHGTDDFYVSNGSAVIRIYADGHEEKICTQDGVYQIVTV